MNNTQEHLILGNTLKLIRAQRDLTMRKFSEITGISPTHICDLENGNRRGTLQVIQKISKTLILSEDENKLLMNAFFHDNSMLPKDLLYYLISNDLLDTIKILKEYDQDGSNVKRLAQNLENNKRL